MSEFSDWDLEDKGTVRLFIIESCVLVAGSTLERDLSSSSSGTSSAAGMGLPLAAATSWFSVHESEWSFRPRQKGAIRRSI